MSPPGDLLVTSIFLWGGLRSSLLCFHRVLRWHGTSLVAAHPSRVTIFKYCLSESDRCCCARARFRLSQHVNLPDSWWRRLCRSSLTLRSDCCNVAVFDVFLHAPCSLYLQSRICFDGSFNRNPLFDIEYQVRAPTVFSCIALKEWVEEEGACEHPCGRGNSTISDA